MYERAVEMKPRSWNDVEAEFLAAMEAFDKNVAAGIADQGDRQNGKGDCFNDLLALILENCSGVGTLYSRGNVPGLIIPKHKLDVTYPPDGVVEFMLEAKAVGTPKHPRSPNAKDYGRPGSADLDKRIKEVGFKSFDLKSEYGRQKTMRGEPATVAGDVSLWLRTMKPTSFLFISARVVSPNDLARVVGYAHAATLVNDAVGVFAFQPLGGGNWTQYTKVEVPASIAIDRVLYRACTELMRIRDSEREPVVHTGSTQDLIPDPEGDDTSEF